MDDVLRYIAAFLKWLENHFEDTIVARQRYFHIWGACLWPPSTYIRQNTSTRCLYSTGASVPIKFKFPHLIFQYVLWLVYVHTLCCYWSRHNNVVTPATTTKLVSAASYAHHIKVVSRALWYCGCAVMGRLRSRLFGCRSWWTTNVAANRSRNTHRLGNADSINGSDLKANSVRWSLNSSNCFLAKEKTP